jgi:mannosyltransferase OCH1-like enzyme
MNYYLIKNKFDKVKYNYSDRFNIEIYYLDNFNCQVNVQRLDSTSGWGLMLEIKIFDIDNNGKFEIIKFGNSDENIKTLYFTTNIKLYINSNTKLRIPSIVLPRNEFILLNRYELLLDDRSIDFHIVLYYIEEYKIKIIIRRLDDESGWQDNLKILVYDSNSKSLKEIINIGNSDINYKIITKDTKIELKYKSNEYDQSIPKIIFQTGNSKNFKNILHFNSIMSFIELNPEYKYIYYDDVDARKFLRENFSDEINYSYDLLVPGAFKADLLRYCFLYHYGGCYFDCKQILRIQIRDILNPNSNIVLCNDVIDNALLNAIIFSTEKNSIIEKTIKDCVYNIINKFGSNALDITGPIFFYKSIKKYISEDTLLLQNNRPLENFHDFNNDYFNNNVTLIKNNRIFLNRFYKGYYDNYLDTSHYGKLYNNNEVYYKNFQKVDNYRVCVYPNNYNDKFIFKIINDRLVIKRTNSADGWYFNLKVLIITELFSESLIEVGDSRENIKDIDISSIMV